MNLIIKFNPHHFPKDAPEGRGGQFAPSGNFAAPHYTGVTFEHPAPESIKDVVRLLNKHGFEGYIVGGTVRDLMSGKQVHDYDMTTSASTDQIKKVFAGRWNADPRGEAHGTIRVPAGDDYIELTAYRRDKYSNGRHAVTEHTKDLREDLKRRDLLVNALAWNPLTGELVGPGKDGDPTAALEDMRNHVIRFNSTDGDNGEDIIRADKLRAIRAVRFATMGSGWHLAPEAAQAIRNTVEDVRTAFNLPKDAEGKLSGDRFKDETIKAFGYRSGGEFPRRLHEVGLLDVFHPELTKLEGQRQNVHHHEDVLHHIFTVTENVGGGPVERLSAMFHDVGKSPSDYEVNGKRIARGTAILSDKVVGDRPYGYSFIEHENEGAKIVEHVLGPHGYNYPADVRDQVVKNVKGHMAIPLPSASDKAIRKWARTIGIDKVDSALALRRADYTAKPHSDYPAEAFADRVHRLMTEAPPTTKLAINGNDIMQVVGKPPGPWMKDAFAAVNDFLDSVGPSGNTRAQLLTIVRQWKEKEPK